MAGRLEVTYRLESTALPPAYSGNTAIDRDPITHDLFYYAVLKAVRCHACVKHVVVIVNLDRNTRRTVEYKEQGMVESVMDAMQYDWTSTVTLRDFNNQQLVELKYTDYLLPRHQISIDDQKKYGELSCGVLKNMNVTADDIFQLLEERKKRKREEK